MFVAGPVLIESAAPPSGHLSAHPPAPARPFERLVRALERQRALLAWNRGHARPVAFHRSSSRVWKRHSALLTTLADAREEHMR